MNDEASVSWLLLAALTASLGGCTAPAPADADANADTGRADVGGADAPEADAGDAAVPRADAGGGDTGSPMTDAGPSRCGNASDWILDHFAAMPVVTGPQTERTFVETPALVRDASGCCAKYAFDVREERAPARPEIGFVRVSIMDLMSGDAFGGGIYTSNAPGAVLFLDDVTIEPGWPTWVSYSTTNKDGMVLDNAAAIYGEDVTIRNWNADGGIDNKAPISQFVRLTIEGRGYRAMRYWEPGPHYLVESSLSRDESIAGGALLWFFDCDAVTVRVYDTTFNGARTITPDLIDCDNGSNPTIEYLTTDPRTTGEMHPMFCSP